VPKLSEASESTKILRAFFEAESNLPKNIFKYLAMIENKIKEIKNSKSLKFEAFFLYCWGSNLGGFTVFLI